MLDPLRERDWDLEDEVEAEGLAKLNVQFILRSNFGRAGFRVSDQFIEDWTKRSAAGQVGTTRGFRQRFCDANHYEVAVPIKGKTRILRVVELWGLPVVYFFGDSPKPELNKIMPRGWHLSKVGRSVRPPPLCTPKP
jgi:hypothetical protein